MTFHATKAAFEGPLAEPERTVSNYGVASRFIVAFAVMTLLLGGVGGWAATAELAGAVIAPGAVVVDQHVKKIQHRDGGIVSEINVRNGQKVAKGDLLLRLDETQTKAELGVIQSQLLEMRGRLARVAAESSGLQDITFPTELTADRAAAQVLAGEARLFSDNKKTLSGQLKQLGERVGQLEEEVKGITAQRSAKEQELKLMRKELEGAQTLENQKLTPITRIYALQRDEARLNGEYGSLIAQAARASGQISEIRIQMLTLDQSARTDALKDLRTVEARIAELAEREIAAKDRLARMEIRAPIDGLVHELSAFTVGGVVTAAEPVMLIVPEGQPLSIEIRVAPSDINQVYVGQPARLRFSSFNQRTTPEINGTVTYVSADISHDPKGKPDYFTANVSLSEALLAVDGKPILPGMPVEAHVTTDKRTALSYLLKPVTDQVAKTFRER